MNAVLEAAREYVRRGWSVVPVEARSKKPAVEGWPELRIREADLPCHFSGERNVSILTGKASGGLIDVDLDCPETLRLAERLLPPTQAIFGRPGNSRSHRLYVCDGARSCEWRDPAAGGRPLLELRADRRATLAPPSVHPSGEVIAWEKTGEPARVEAGELEKACGRLAAAVLLARSWKQGNRQALALALAGGLLRAGWGEDETREFILAVAESAEDEEIDKRLEAISDTRRKDGPTTGWPRLAEILGERTVEILRRWLGEERKAADKPRKKPRILDARELLAREFPPQEEIVEGLLPEGGIAILAGPPKSGKSWFALDLACGVSAGTTVCGRPVLKRMPVLYLALEDGERRLHSRMITAGLDPGPDCSLAVEWAKLNEGGLEDLRDTIRGRKIGLVIIDVLQKLRPLSDGRRLAYETDYLLMGSLQDLAREEGVTILLLTHLRKLPSDDPLEQVSGSVGLTGGADTVLILKRARGEADATLQVTGRDIEEQELALRFDRGRWSVMGEAREWALTLERRKILDAIRELGGEGRPKEIAEAAELRPDSVRHILRKMELEGLVKGIRGVYRLLNNDDRSPSSSPPPGSLRSRRSPQNMEIGDGDHFIKEDRMGKNGVIDDVITDHSLKPSNDAASQDRVIGVIQVIGESDRRQRPLPADEEFLALARGTPVSEWRRLQNESEFASTKWYYYSNMARLREALDKGKKTDVRLLVNVKHLAAQLDQEGGSS